VIFLFLDCDSSKFDHDHPNRFAVGVSADRGAAPATNSVFPKPVSVIAFASRVLQLWWERYQGAKALIFLHSRNRHNLCHFFPALEALPACEISQGCGTFRAGDTVLLFSSGRNLAGCLGGAYIDPDFLAESVLILLFGGQYSDSLPSVRSYALLICCLRANRLPQNEFWQAWNTGFGFGRLFPLSGLLLFAASSGCISYA